MSNAYLLYKNRVGVSMMRFDNKEIAELTAEAWLKSKKVISAIVKSSEQIDELFKK